MSDEQKRAEEAKRQEANRRLMKVMHDLKADMNDDPEAEGLFDKFKSQKAAAAAAQPTEMASSRAGQASDADFDQTALPDAMFAPTPTPGSAAGSAAAAPAGPAASLPPAIPRPFEGNRGYQQSSDMAGWRDKGFSGAINKLMGSKKPAMGGLVSDAARGNDIPLTERPPSGRLYSGDARVRPSDAAL